MKIPQIKNKTTILAHYSTYGYLFKGNKTLIQKDIHTPMSIAVSFIVAKIQNHPVSLWMIG